MIYPVEITPLTLVDYPGKAAAVLWYGGCNLSCPYCYNDDIAKRPGKQRDNIFEIIEREKHLLDGVVLSGGEATLNPHIKEIAEKIKEMGLLVKLDTNGTRPDVVAELLKNGLLDYVAVDCKYGKDSTLCWGPKNMWELFSTTVKLLVDSGIQFEVRTTVHSDLMSENHVVDMISDVKELGYNGTYYIQPFVLTSHNLANIGKPSNELSWSSIQERCKNLGINVEIRKP